MAGLPADDIFRRPDPFTMEGNPNIVAAQEVTEDSLSTSSQLREEAIQTATVKEEWDESCHN